MNLTFDEGDIPNVITRLNADGTPDVTFNIEGDGVDNFVNTVSFQPDGKIFIGGQFTSYNRKERKYGTRLNSDGSLDINFNPQTGANNTVTTLSVQEDGKILLGGDFTSYEDISRNRIARLNADGTLDTSFDPGIGPNYYVNFLLKQPDNKILIGGHFTSYNSTSRNHIARLNADGTLDTSFDPGVGTNGPIYNMIVQPDNKIIVSGSFTSYDGITRNRIARLHSNGSLDTGFNPGTGANDEIKALVVQPNGKVLIGGSFTSFNSTGRNRVARLNANGSLDTSFDPGSGFNAEIKALILGPDGKVIVGGSFTSFNGTGRNRIARLNANGSLDTSFDPGSGTNGFINTLVIQTNGKIIIAGNFGIYNGMARSKIARLGPNGSPDASFYTDQGPNSDVNTLALQPDGKILVGGYFTSYDRRGRNRVARIFGGETTFTWMGPFSNTWGVTNNWNDSRNWSSYTVPTSADDVVIPAGRLLYPVLSSSVALGIASVKNLTVEAGASLTITSGNLSLFGNFINSGIFSHTNGLVSFTGATTQTVSGSSSTIFRNLTIGSQGLSLNSAAGLKGILTLTGNLTTNGNPFTVISDASGTGMVVNSGGVVNGTVTVQRRIHASANGGRGYRHYASPVVNTTVADLATAGFTPIVNPAYNALPTPPISFYTAVTYPTIFAYEESRLSSDFPGFGIGWASPSSLSSVLTPGRGYSVNIPATATVDLNGTLNNGPVSVSLSRGPVAESGWHLLGNPYPSPITWSNITLPANVGNAVYAFRTSGGSNGSYAYYVNGVGNLTNGTIPMMQGFFVRASGPATFTFTNAARLKEYANPSFRTGTTRPLLELHLSAADGQRDEAFFYLEEGATLGVDGGYDAFKVQDNYGGQPTLYSFAASEKLSVTGLPPMQGQAMIVPLGLKTSQVGQHTFKAVKLLNFEEETHVILEDKSLGILKNLTREPEYSFTPSANDQSRFVLHFQNARLTSLHDLEREATVVIYPNPTSTGSLRISLEKAKGKKLMASLYSSVGKLVSYQETEIKGGTVQSQISTQGLPAGMYLLKLSNGLSETTRKVIVQ